LKLLADRGIDYFFANAGTDFTPIIEAFAKAQALNIPAPTPIAKLAARDKLVIATEGDGAYMFGNPVSAHYVAAAMTCRSSRLFSIMSGGMPSAARLGRCIPTVMPSIATRNL